MKKAVALFALVLASLALVACGGSDDDSTTGNGGETTSESSGNAGGGEPSGGTTLPIAAAESGLAYSSDTAEAEAGKVTVDFSNPQPLQHDVAFEDSGGKEVGATELITEGETTTTVDFKPGSYTFFCTVPGHREAGMEGTLTVK
jgi:plastocyanin